MDRWFLVEILTGDGDCLTEINSQSLQKSCFCRIIFHQFFEDCCRVASLLHLSNMVCLIYIYLNTSRTH